MSLWTAPAILPSSAVDLRRVHIVPNDTAAFHVNAARLNAVTASLTSNIDRIGAEIEKTRQKFAPSDPPMNMAPVDAVFSNTHATSTEGGLFDRFTKSYWFLGSLLSVVLISVIKSQ